MSTPDENDLLRAGRLNADVFDETEPVALPSPAAEPALDAVAPTMAAVYGLAHLEADEKRELVSFGNLPPWPGGSAPGHGWGDDLDERLGRGICPGEMTVIGAASAGAGKTAFLMQVAEGAALRNLSVARHLSDASRTLPFGPQLTPVFVASEMAASALTWRSLARWTGYPAWMYRGGATVLRRRISDVPDAWKAARMAFEGDWGKARAWMRLMTQDFASAQVAAGAGAFVGALTRQVERWREQIAHEHPTHKGIVPVVVIDPTQRFQGTGDDAVGALNDLARALCAAAIAHEWVVLLSSDTNKDASGGKNTGSDVERGAAAIRGSYNLQHEVTNALFLQPPRGYEPSEEERAKGLRDVELVVVKNRWGSPLSPWPRFTFDGAKGRFLPLEAEEARQKREQTQEKNAAAGKKRKDVPAYKPGGGAFDDDE